MAHNRSDGEGPPRAASKKIPVSEPHILPEDVEFVSKRLEEKQVSGRAPVVGEFEEKFAGYLVVDHSLACCNGTTALHLAVKALDLKPHDEVVVPAFTMISPVLALLYEGLKPVPVDVDPKYWIMDSRGVRKKITPKTRAIMAVHTYGNPIVLDEIMELAKERGLYVVEDCAEALGATYGGDKVGSKGDISTFSFFANKLITCGEGGMVCTSNGELADRVARARDLYFGRKNKFLHEKLGYNYRMSGLQAALGLSQLRRIDTHLAMIRKIARTYTERLRRAGQVETHSEPPGTMGSFWMYSIVLGRLVDRAMVMDRLLKRGVDTRPFFVPVHEQPVCSKELAGERFPVSEEISRSGLNLPSGLSLGESEIETVCSALADSIAGGR